MMLRLFVIGTCLLPVASCSLRNRSSKGDLADDSPSSLTKSYHPCHLTNPRAGKTTLVVTLSTSATPRRFAAPPGLYVTSSANNFNSAKLCRALQGIDAQGDKDIALVAIPGDSYLTDDAINQVLSAVEKSPQEVEGTLSRLPLTTLTAMGIFSSYLEIKDLNQLIGSTLRNMATTAEAQETVRSRLPRSFIENYLWALPLYAATRSGLKISVDGLKTFTTMTSKDGIGSDVVRDVFVDHSGKIHLGTAAGLTILEKGGGISNRSDLDLWNKGAASSSADFVNVGVDSLFVDAQGTIYVGSRFGLSRSSDGGASFSLFGPEGTKSVWGIFVDQSKKIYVATATGLLQSDDGGATFTKKTTAHGLRSNWVDSVSVDGGGTIYVGNQEGLDLSTDQGRSFHPWNFTERIPYASLEDGKKQYYIPRIIVANNGTIYLVNRNGLVIAKPGEKPFVFKLSGDDETIINDVAISPGGDLYLATSRGIARSTDGGIVFAFPKNTEGVDRLALGSH